MHKHKEATSIVWFRKDLRIEDNPALQAAIDLGYPILPLFIYAPDEESPWQPGGASKWWLHHALVDLDKQLRKVHLRLCLAKGNTETTLKKWVTDYNVKAVFWNRRYEPAIIERDKHIKETLKKLNIEANSFNGSLLFEPHQISNKSGKPFQVFTPFWKYCLTQNIPSAHSTQIQNLQSPKHWPESLDVEDLQLLPEIPWDKGMQEFWDPTIKGGTERLNTFLKDDIGNYAENRDLPYLDGTSLLSPYLHFGQISPRQIWWQTHKISKINNEGTIRFLAEIGWREFAYHLLYHFPHTPTDPLQEKFKKFPWTENQEILEKWQKGLTGYPIVDAGLRQLWKTGWMHNRVRMIVASFLVKHLQQHWVEGARWFWDTLVDADLASNTLGWQWSAGCGADAAPYFRIFNPILQGQKFDPEGQYIKHYIPELFKVPPKYIHAPWEAPKEVLKACGITLGIEYPKPLVEHEFARKRALDAFEKIKG